MDAATLDKLKSDLRQLVTESIGDTIAELKKNLPDFSSKYNALLLIESRLNDANLKSIQNLLSDEALQIEYNQIRVDLLLFISSLETKDFELPQGASGGRTGSLLYKIPEQMQLQQETKCIVRLAFEQESIIRNIELNKDVTIKQIRVAEVMQVELIDPSSEHPFEIRTISDEEQFVEKGDYSEWIFYVKPLIAGTFPLVLKISVIEIVQGKERLRNITWEETIEIKASAPAVSTSEFKSTGIAVGTNTDHEVVIAEEEVDAIVLPDVEIFEPESAPPAPAPVMPSRAKEVPMSPQPTLPQRKRSNRTWMAAAASILLIVTVAIFMLPNQTSSNQEEDTRINPAPAVKGNSEAELPQDTIPPDSLSETR